jgi:hypothetical protein
MLSQKEYRKPVTVERLNLSTSLCPDWIEEVRTLRMHIARRTCGFESMSRKAASSMGPTLTMAFRCSWLTCPIPEPGTVHVTGGRRGSSPVFPPGAILGLKP